VLDVPVTGAVMAAEAGTLGVLVSGPAPALEVVRPVLETFAGKILNFGLVPGQAQVAKLVNNALAFANLFAAFETLAVGVKAGIDKRLLAELFNAGSAANFATAKILPNYILPGRFEGLGAMETGMKDLRLYLEEIELRGIHSPIAAKMAQLGRK
jgi:2-hydroxy-3-oxopropionate reductase